VSRISVQPGSKVFPHPLHNSSGVIKFDVARHSYWFNPGGDVHPLYEKIQRVISL
jgi:hypothetical protein